jgi:hypothetical protein
VANLDVTPVAPPELFLYRSRVADGPAALEALASEGFDPRAEVILPAPEPGFGVPPTGFTSAVRIVEARPDRVRLEAELSAPGLVVLLDGYDPGWQASVDGAPAPVRRANVAFRAVPVPAGRHVIEQVYRPRSALAGAVASLAALFAAAAAWILGRPR